MAETVYANEDGHVMSEKVQTLAASIYQEFERMIKYYDENVVKELMPLVVGVLENLDANFQEKQENDVEIELLREDNEQLMTQYEREKQLRKSTEQKCLLLEDTIEDESCNLQNKVESLESQIRMLELKSRNASDHVSRLEDKEENSKKEYNKLHERYTELFKTHMEYMERTKMAMGVDREGTSVTPRQKAQNFQLPNLRPLGSTPMIGNGETPTRGEITPDTPYRHTPGSRRESNTNLKTELLKSPEVDNKSRKDANRNTMTSTGIGCGSITTSERSTSKEDLHKLVKETVQGYYAQNNNTPPAVKNSSTKSDTNTTPKSGTTVTTNETATDSGSNDVGVSESCQTKGEDQVDEEIQTSIEISQKEEKQKLFNNMLEGNDEFEQSIGVVHRKYKPAQKDKSELDIEEDDMPCDDTKNESSIYDELAFEDSSLIGEMDDGVDITGRVCTPGEYSSAEDSDTDSHVSDSFFGMSKEVENLIAENTELIATKNALNIVKDDLIAQVDELNGEQEMLKEQVQSLETVKSRLKLRVTELEDELKKVKEELVQKSTASNPGDEEDDVPMSMRKRFTRVEMARVLMERNQYKERLMELQEAVRWTEMIRASKEHPELQPKKKSSIWNFFSNLFSSSNKPPKRPLPSAVVRYKAPTTEVQPVGDPNRKKREKYNLGSKSKAYDFMEEEGVSDKSRKEREKERREQYKQVRAHVKKEDGRLQAYGWSLPAKLTTIPSQQSVQNKPQVPVPVPVYCRPLLEKEHGMKMWCAAGVTLSGGRTRDGGSVIGASVFYTTPSEEVEAPANDVDRLSSELTEHQKAAETDQDQMSSLVWICTTAQATSRVTVIDANNPGEILECFHVTSSHILCIQSIPGAKESDFPVDEEFLNCGDQLKSETSSTHSQMSKNSSSASLTSETSASTDTAGIGGVTFVQCATGSSSRRASNSTSPVGSVGPEVAVKELSPEAQADVAKVTDAIQSLTTASLKDKSEERTWSDEEQDNNTDHGDPLGVSGVSTPDIVRSTVTKAIGSPVHSGESSPARTLISSEKRMMSEPTELVKDGLNAVPSKDGDFMMVEVNKMSSILPTMWLGSQSGSLYVHSSGAQWKRCLHSVKLKDSVLSIIHVRGRVLVALADGTVAIFHRDKDGQWDLKNYHLLDLGRPHHSIRCMVVVANKYVWCGYKNTIHVVNPATLKVEKSFDAHPRKESQVRQMAWVGDGVWVSIRLDSTLRLYHAYTHQHLQDVDIEPYVSKMLGTGKLGFSFVRITSLTISCNRLWIGTGNGVVISVPLSESSRHPVTTGGGGSMRPGGVIRVYTDAKSEAVTPGSFIPYCSMSQAQLSFHGHRDAVKFFVSVPGIGAKGLGTTNQPPKGDSSKGIKKTMLVMSGGEGYIDFRIGDGDEDEESLENPTELQSATISRGERSHLIVWEVACPD